MPRGEGWALLVEVGDSLGVEAGELGQFDDIDPPIAALGLRDPGLGATEPLGDLGLSEPRIETRGPQPVQKAPVRRASRGRHRHAPKGDAISEYSISESAPTEGLDPRWGGESESLLNLFSLGREKPMRTCVCLLGAVLLLVGASAQAGTITYNLTLDASFIDDGAGVLGLSLGDPFQVTMTVDDADLAANPSVGIYTVQSASLITPGSTFAIPGPGLSATDTSTRIGELGLGEIKLLQQFNQSVPDANDVRFQLVRLDGQSSNNGLFANDDLPATLPDPSNFDLDPLFGEFRFVVNASTSPTVTTLRGNVTSVPEPGVAVLFGLGLMALVCRRRAIAPAAITAAVVLAGSAPTSAATLNVVGNQLVGASGVDVGGTLYDVQFLEGTCISLYSGCDSVSDFPFQTTAAANLASQSLLDQVFIDGPPGNFDSSPQLTQGCSSSSLCIVVTPDAHQIPSSLFLSSLHNSDVEANDLVFGSSFASKTFDSTTAGGHVYAVWTAVPEPGTAFLFGAGLVSIASLRRRAKR